MAKRRPIAPRTFFLNERHELPVEEKTGGGRTAQYADIDWADKGQRLERSLKNVTTKSEASKDPLRGKRYFMLAAPEPHLTKISKDKKKAPPGTFDEETSFGRDHARVFSRLGLDLINVTNDGNAVVHATSRQMDVIQDQAHSLASLGTRDRSRWATLQEFGIVPAELRVDVEWLREIQTAKLPAEVVIELQPLLTAIDVEAVVRGITAVLSQHKDCQLTTTGQDYSGRTWFRGRIVPGVIAEIAMDFFSVQAMHSPLTSIVVAGKERPTVTGNVSLPDFGAPLPVVASLDTGVPSEHPQLASYRRGQFLAPNAAGRSLGIHGSHVASRIVFGNVSHDEIQSGSVKAECAFLDGQVAVTSTDIDEKAVMQALQGIRGAFPDVRVFNCSFSNRVPFSEMPTVRRDERKRYMRDLDNFVIRQ